MEPGVHQVLLKFYQENLWLYIIYTLQRVIIFWREEGKFQFWGKHSPNSIN